MSPSIEDGQPAPALRFIAHMDEHGYDYCVPVEPPEWQERGPLLELSSGYVKRALAELPTQGEEAPWRVHQNWFLDHRMFRHSPVEDGHAVPPRR